MKKNKAMAKEIWKMLFFYPKTSKELYHHIKISEKYNEQGVFYKKSCLIISQYSQKNTCVRVSFIIKMPAFRPVTLLKRDSCEYCDIFKNSCFEQHLWTAASDSFSFYVIWTFPYVSKLRRNWRRRSFKNNTKKTIVKLS